MTCLRRSSSKSGHGRFAAQAMAALAILSASMVLQGCSAYDDLPIDPQTGIRNFSRVSDTLYRGAQPEDDQFEALRQLGIRTIVCMRTFNMDKSHVDGTGMNLVHISFKAGHVEDEDVMEFLAIATDPAAEPVFVHCKHGADRTGLMVAVYRMVVQDWPRQQAIDEMYAMGFNDDWFNIRRYVERVDAGDLRRRLAVAHMGARLEARDAATMAAP